MSLKLSVIIPVFNEADAIASCWQNILAALHVIDGMYEVVFVDGGSADDTIDKIKTFPCRLVLSDKGRAQQMNAGAEIADGDTLLFLHVDTCLPVFEMEILKVLSRNQWGYFHVELDNNGFIYRWIGKGINFRSRVSHVATGDQCIFVSRIFFHEQGGYANLPLMEDVELSHRFKKIILPVFLPLHAKTSARRWEKHGAIRTVLLMWSFQLAFRVGVPASYLAKRY